MYCRRVGSRLRWLWEAFVLSLAVVALLALAVACEEEGEAGPAPASTPTAEATSPPDDAHAPEATPTPEATTTAESSPTEEAAGLATDKVSDYTDSLGILHVVGEVKNNQDFDAEFVKVYATFFDADGNPLTNDFAFSCLRIVPAGGDSPFEIKLLDPPAGIDHYTLEVQGEESSEPPGTDLEFSDVTAWMDFIDVYHLLGEVTNQSGTTYDYVRICGALYGLEGEVVRSDLTFVCEEAVGPGESAEFWLEEPVSGVLVDHHRLWVQGE